MSPFYGCVGYLPQMCMRSALFGVYCCSTLRTTYPKSKQGQRRECEPSIPNDVCHFCCTGAWHMDNLYRDMREINCAQSRQREREIWSRVCRSRLGLLHLWLTASHQRQWRPHCIRPEALNGSESSMLRSLPTTVGLFGLLQCSGVALQGIHMYVYLTFKFIARLFKSFIFHYWSDESIDDFF